MGDIVTRFALMIALICVSFAPISEYGASADLRSAPLWYDQNAVTTTPDWHYRVPITVPAGTFPNSTIRFDVDFNALLLQMGVTGTFDINSPRVVRSTGALATTQEFTDRVFNGATDVAGDGRGEVRFLLEDSAGAAAVTYYLYFDITQNGAKPVNPQVPINGNFERGAAGTAQPTGWNAPAGTVTTLDAQVRPNETVSVTTNGGGANPATRNTDGTARTGDFSYLIGARTANETATGTRILTRTFVAPATNLGNFAIRWRVEGWDSSNFDTVAVSLTDGTTVTNVVGAAVAGSYSTAPYSPNMGSTTQSATVSGYQPYNNFDLTTTGLHTAVPPMTVTAQAEPWWTRSVALPASYAGKTITVTITSTHVTQYRSWTSIDDVEWSVVNGTLGTPQAFGVNIVTPVTASTFTPGQFIPITAQVDANPTNATNPVTAAIYDSAGTLLAGGFILYNDGTHGDVTAGDAIWSNDGSIVAQPAPTVPLTATTGAGYVLRVFARDAATSGGLAQIPGAAAPQIQANFWNIDEITFNVQTAAVTLVKSSTVIPDPVSGVNKAIPGATIEYCLLVTNSGPLPASTIILSDPVPTNVTFTPGSMKSGTTCLGAATVEDDNNTGTDESDPIGASFATGTIITLTSTIANGGTLALTFRATIN
jgi:uncharacterized repeat protein (TIGR01451 family)